MSIKEKDIKEVVITTYEQLKTVFLAFEAIADNYTIFESRIWVDTWYRNYWQKNWQLNCVVYYHGDKLIGFAPFYLQHSTKFPYLRSLHLLGQGEPEAAEVASEYLDIQIIPLYTSQVYSLLTRYINAAKFDVFNASALLVSSHVVNILPQLKGDISQRHYLRYLVNCAKWSIEQVSKNTRSRIKRARNQLQQYNVDIRWLSNTEITQHWPTLVSFHQDRWTTKGNSGAFHTEAFNLFHLSLIKNHATSVEVSAIFIDEAPIAINYYVKDKNTLYFYQSGWDQKNYAKLSPGLYLHCWSIENCATSQYDFMMGGVNDSYKAKFAGETQPMVSLSIIKNKPKLFILKVINSISSKLFP